jgi:DNA polymerase III subunit epsilon
MVGKHHISHIQTNTVPIDVERAIYIVFDLETTGFSPECNYIIDIACEMVTVGGNIIPDSKYSSLVKPPTPIPRLITTLTSIIYGMVHSRKDFNVIGNELFKFIKHQITNYEHGREEAVEHIVFVTHTLL